MRRSRFVAGGALAVLPWLACWRPTAPARPHAAPDAGVAWLARDGCTVCHPGAKKALGYSVHAGLLTAPTTQARACVVCHVDGEAHAQSALDPLGILMRPQSVTAAACAACHPGRDLAPSAGAHPWSSQLDRAALPAAPPSPPPPAALPPPAELPAASDYDLSASLRAGYRFVNVFGSRARYDTDLNLDGGFRLTDLELSARGRQHAALDHVTLTLTDLADPYMRLRAEASKDGVATGKARFEKDAFKYRARGDFHRVDIKAQEWGFDLFVPVSATTELSGSFTRRLQDGFWLTRRIGNRNVTPITSVPGVASPRDHDLDLFEAAVQTRALGPTVRMAFEYRDHNDVDTFAYARSAPTNPAFPESEDFTSKSTLRGPGARVDVHDKSGALAWGLTGRVLDLNRRIRGNGVTTGFDIAEFDTTTTAFAQGGAQTWLADATATWTLSEEFAVLGDLRWRDHEEKLHLDQVDVTRYPSLGNATTVALDLDQRTAQRVLEGSVTLQFDPWQSLRVAAGYGFAREWLRVPDLVRNDSDFERGLIQNDGVLLDLDWRPNKQWVVSARAKAFGQNGVQLHEVSDDEVRTVKGKVRYQRARYALEGFTENRQKSNDVSSTKLDAWTSGGTATFTPGEKTSLWTSYAYTDLESRTLTTFYFDPSPTPVPTFVGFDGVTHTWSVGFGVDVWRRVRLEVSGAYTSTEGSFDVQVFDWRADLSAQVCSSADMGVLVRQVDYREDAAQSAGVDDYGSYLTFVYVRTR
jgi:hypothetical protein